MGIWDKLQDELHRAGRAAQGAIDEGKLRIEIFRVRQLADKAAQALGYAVYRARAGNDEVDAATWDRLAGTLREHEAEAKKLEEQLAQSTAPTPDQPAPAEAAPAAADDSPPNQDATPPASGA
ncbi:MAG: hypothetical protein ACYC3L_05435 [Gemmatimonadaceae bacterium]